MLTFFLTSLVTIVSQRYVQVVLLLFLFSDLNIFTIIPPLKTYDILIAVTTLFTFANQTVDH